MAIARNHEHRWGGGSVARPTRFEEGMSCLLLFKCGKSGPHHVAISILLFQLTIDIGTEVRSQNHLLDDMVGGKTRG